MLPLGCLLLVAVGTSPPPVAMWTFQEDAGTPRLSVPPGRERYALLDGDPAHPVGRSKGGVFGPYAASFDTKHAPNSTAMRLYAPRSGAHDITVGLGGPNATVTLVAWVQQTRSDGPEGFIAGVWDEDLRARQYALFTQLAACRKSPKYAGGLAAHISNCGGPTPGQRYCETAGCDPDQLPAKVWHCLANVYDGRTITAYLNGTLHKNGDHNPFPYPGGAQRPTFLVAEINEPFPLRGCSISRQNWLIGAGIFSPEAAQRPGAEFGVGCVQFIRPSKCSLRPFVRAMFGRFLTTKNLPFVARIS